HGILTANPFSNSTIAVVVTTASLSKHQVNKIAQMAHDGIAQTIHPAHTMFDGDTIFGLAIGPKLQLMTNSTIAASQVSAIGAAAATTLGRAIIKAVQFDNRDRKSTRLNSSHGSISYAVFCLKKKNIITKNQHCK